MAEKGFTTLARLVSMVHVIDEKPGITVDELSERFGRPPRAIRADIETLDRAGIADLLPGNTFEIDYDLYLEEGRVALRSPLQLSAPLPLTAAELARLTTALSALAPLLHDGELAELPHALSLLLPMTGTQAPGEGEGEDIVSLTTAVRNPLRPLIHLLEDAIEGSAILRFNYRDAKGRRTTRTFRPELVSLGRDGWVVTGQCLISGDERNFRLDRMSEVTATSDAPVEVETEAPPSPNRADPVPVTVLLDASAQWVLTESSPATVTVREDGLIEATFGIWDDEWFRTELLLLAPWVIASDPPEYLQMAGRYARDAQLRRQSAPAPADHASLVEGETFE